MDGSDERFAIVAEPARWTLVSSALPIEQAPVEDPGYARWAAAHLDRHAHQEILFCLEGETFERFDGRDYRCRPGSVFLIDSREEHARGYPPEGGAFTHLE
jgi:hypothetical protein